MPRRPAGAVGLKMDDQYDQGDFSFVSSDECIFRVRSKDIMNKGNATLRHAVKTCLGIPDSPLLVELDEPAPVVRHFLNAFLHSTAPSPFACPIEVFYALVQFSTTLKASPVINLLRPLLPKYIPYKKADPYPIFRCAVLYEDWYTAGDAFAKYSKDHVWRRDNSERRAADLALGCKTGTFDMDPAGLPYHYWMELPKKVSWAMVRACAERAGWKERGERFTELMLFIDERDVVFPKWAAMEIEATAEASSDDSSSSRHGEGDIIDEEDDPAAPGSLHPVQTPSRPSTQPAPLLTPTSSQSSTRIRLRLQEPLFMPRTSASPDPVSESDRMRVDTAVEGDEEEEVVERGRLSSVLLQGP